MGDKVRSCLRLAVNKWTPIEALQSEPAVIRLHAYGELSSPPHFALRARMATASYMIIYGRTLVTFLRAHWRDSPEGGYWRTHQSPCCLPASLHGDFLASNNYRKVTWHPFCELTAGSSGCDFLISNANDLILLCNLCSSTFARAAFGRGIIFYISSTVVRVHSALTPVFCAWGQSVYTDDWKWLKRPNWLEITKPPQGPLMARLPCGLAASWHGNLFSWWVCWQSR